MIKSLIEDIKSKIEKKCGIIISGGKEETRTTKAIFTNRHNKQIYVDCFETNKMPDTIEVAHQQKQRQVCLTEDQFGNSIARTALLLKEAIDTRNTRVAENMANILVRDIRKYSMSNFRDSNEHYSKTLQKLDMKHLLSLCENCIEKHNIVSIVGNSKYSYFFDTGTCKHCGEKGEVYVGYRAETDT